MRFETLKKADKKEAAKTKTIVARLIMSFTEIFKFDIRAIQ